MRPPRPRAVGERGSRPGVRARRGAPQLWGPKGRGTGVRPERRGGGEGALPSGLLRGGPSPWSPSLTFLLPKDVAARAPSAAPARGPGSGPCPPAGLPAAAAAACRALSLLLLLHAAHLNEDTGRFVLLAALIGLYLVAGATVFSALESPGEAEARARWGRHAAQLQRGARRGRAGAARLPPGTTRPRWQPASEPMRCARAGTSPARFYFVGTVVSTMGELRARRRDSASASFTCRPFHCSGARAAFPRLPLPF